MRCWAYNASMNDGSNRAFVSNIPDGAMYDLLRDGEDSEPAGCGGCARGCLAMTLFLLALFGVILLLVVVVSSFSH